jgi:hypothetical protein
VAGVGAPFHGGVDSVAVGIGSSGTLTSHRALRPFQQYTGLPPDDMQNLGRFVIAL